MSDRDGASETESDTGTESRRKFLAAAGAAGIAAVAGCQGDSGG
ncbi:twin-arginine translocation signal domain-containing protein, partial [Halobium palmae]